MEEFSARIDQAQVWDQIKNTGNAWIIKPDK